MKKNAFFFFLITVVLLFTACSAHRDPFSSVLRKAEDTPDRFAPAEGIVLDGSSCKSPLVDTRDGTELVMVSSQKGMGIYKVAKIKYGLQKGEALMLNCASGEVLGIVKIRG